MRIYYGWVVVACGILITCIGLGSAFSLAVFLQPMSEETGWSRTGISSAAMLVFLAMGIAAFFWGAMNDRHGTRPVVFCGGILLGISLVGASYATTVLQFQLFFGVVGGLAAGAFYAPLTAAATAWFVRHRSLAVALITSGIGIGSMTVSPLARALITAYDWRTALFILGCLGWVITLGCALLLRRPPPEAAEAEGARGGPASPAAPAGHGMTVAEALRTPQFAAIALTHFACCAAHSGPIFHMITYAIGCGIAPMAATTVLSVAGFSGLIGRIACGLLADRIGAKPIVLLGLSTQALSVGLYLVVDSLPAFYALSVLFGLSYGGVMPLYGILVRDYFGARIMGSVFGAVAMVSTLGMAIGPWAGGYVFDRFASYDWFYIASLAIGIGAVLIALTCRPPRAAAAAA